MIDNLTKTLIQRLEEYFEAKIAEGYQIVDRASYLTLRKMAMQDLKVARGSWTRSADALKIIMEKRGIKVPDDIQAKSIEGIKVNLIKSETSEPQAVQSGQPAQSVQTAPLVQPAAKIVTDDMAASWERGLKMGFGKLMALYAKIEAIEVVDVESEKKKMTLADYQKETDDLAHDWVTYCKENNIHLPKFFELAMLVLGSGVILGSPLFNLLILGRKRKKTEAVKELGKNIEKDEEKDSGNRL